MVWLLLIALVIIVIVFLDIHLLGALVTKEEKTTILAVFSCGLLSILKNNI